MHSSPPTGLARKLQRQQIAREETLGEEAFSAIDRMREAATAKFTGGFSPTALTLAYLDWAIHLAAAPGKQLELANKAVRKAARLGGHALSCLAQPDDDPCIRPLPGDRRFAASEWRTQPFNFMAQAFLLNQQWWHNVTHEVPGVERHHEEVVSFVARQILDVFSPSNNPLTNPEVIERARETGGANFIEGWKNWAEDSQRLLAGRPPVGAEHFVPGRNVAVTPGKVVFRNHLIELIQYAPSTPTVHAEPILIVPAWIMKYYILDLSPENSLVRYLVGEGYTVFCISWRNPDADDRDLAIEDYRRSGVIAALDCIAAILPGRRVHAAGYCLGGTLLAIAAAAMARDGEDLLASLTFLAAQTDFSEPGELALFIDASELRMLDSMMWNRGYLSADQMAAAFQLLRSNDLIWSRLVRDYLMGARAPMFDLMAWNADSTRMPYRMQAEYLRCLYLDNDLASGRFMVGGRPAALQNIRTPSFAVATERDHVAPWRSVHKLHLLIDADLTFVLTSGGHNAGIVSEPGHSGRHYRIKLKKHGDTCLGPDEWLDAARTREGSWWTAWAAWLHSQSSSEQVAPPSVGDAAKGSEALCDAPGTYVLQR
ncbi:MAG: polyhydroxyalkanoic acid synthase [Bosea sp.]|uniref:PHA/PHB synthase family protein n=1 Tax=Bosea sp. (in: a-proteobacteria) TaxID=1871050 RepID=UPI001ACF7D7F|nr:alpha/beta fold hydrolase [Bosea sp. (in: a-proteobacteria)]MBN9467287.1 polyhydroxyalkanoic acid synthase [Bosea sp. (in: a-proteobacteria)]